MTYPEPKDVRDAQEWQRKADALAARETLDMLAQAVGEAIAADLNVRCCSSPLPDDSTARKKIPLWEGVLAYFPAALVAAARVSHLGNLKHNPGEPLHHARDKSMDHTDCIARHLVDYQALKASALRSAGEEGWASFASVTAAEEHLGNMTWRVLAFVQQELEGMGRAPLAPRAVQK